MASLDFAEVAAAARDPAGRHRRLHRLHRRGASTLLGIYGLAGAPGADRRHQGHRSPPRARPPTAPSGSWREGTVEDLRKRLDTYRGSLALLRRLVPERNEVPNLLDDISSRAQDPRRDPVAGGAAPGEPGPAPFDTYKYNMSVIGHYDEIGQFLADVASLQRIIVPYDVTVSAANNQRRQGAGRYERVAARGQVPDPDLRQVRRAGRSDQWHLTLVLGLALLTATALVGGCSRRGGRGAGRGNAARRARARTDSLRKEHIQTGAGRQSRPTRPRSRPRQRR